MRRTKTTEAFGFNIQAQLDERGRVLRFLVTDAVPADPDGVNGAVRSRDVTVDAAAGIFVRIHIPVTAAAPSKPPPPLPVLFYVHGGGFCHGSAVSGVYHRHVSALAATGKLLCVSVEYRRAPEYRLPVAYDDCFSALQWLLAGDGRRHDWISGVGDFRRFFLAGDSAGANIVHELGLRAAKLTWPSDVAFSGAVLVHPFFRSGDAGKPLETPELRFMWRQLRILDKLCLPAGQDPGEYAPWNPRLPALSEAVFRRMLVVVAGNDILHDVGMDYYRKLVLAGKCAELDEAANEEHVFHLLNPDSPSTQRLLHRICDFIHANDATWHNVVSSKL